MWQIRNSGYLSSSNELIKFYTEKKLGNLTPIQPVADTIYIYFHPHGNSHRYDDSNHYLFLKPSESKHQNPTCIKVRTESSKNITSVHEQKNDSSSSGKLSIKRDPEWKFSNFSKKLKLNSTKSKQSRLHLSSNTKPSKKLNLSSNLKSSNKFPIIKNPVKKGPSYGSKFTSFSISDWAALCKKFKEGKYKNQSAFLNHSDSNPFTIKQRSLFSQKLKLYKDNKLQEIDLRKRSKIGKFPEVEKRVNDYLNLREAKFEDDKLGISWDFLKIKSVQFANELNIKNFKASNGWLGNTLKRGG